MRSISLLTTAAFLGACLFPPSVLAFVHPGTQRFGYDAITGTGNSGEGRYTLKNFLLLALLCGKNLLITLSVARGCRCEQSRFLPSSCQSSLASISSIASTTNPETTLEVLASIHLCRGRGRESGSLVLLDRDHLLFAETD